MAIQFLNNVNAGDNIEIILGSSDDLKIYHNGSKSSIENYTGDLEITQNADDSDIFIKCDDGSGGVTQYMRFSGSSETIVINKNLRAVDNVRIDVGGATDGRFFHDGTNTHLRTITGDLIIDNQNDDGDIIFKTDNGSGSVTTYFVLNGDTTHAYFSNPGNVGVGTTSPTEKLEVYNNGSDVAVKIHEDAGTHQAKLHLRRGGSDWELINDNHFTIEGEGTERFRITTAGNVGIGTTSPTAKLDVDGEISIGGDQTADQPRLTFRASDESKRFTIESDLDSSTSNDLLVFRGTTTDNILVLKGNGNIGIGTSDPQEKLDIAAGNIRLDNNRELTWASTDANVGRVRIVGNETNDYIQFATDNSERMRLTSTGLGIGTTSPSRKLQVIGTDGVAKFYYNSSFTNAQYSVIDVGMMTSGTAANGFGPKITFRMGGNGFDGFTAGAIGTVRNGADGTHNMTFATSTSNSLTTKMTITNTGNVGVGTTSPSAKLQVEGRIVVTNGGDHVFVANPNNGSFELGDTQQIQDGAKITGDGSHIVFSDADVGIGTTSPDGFLHIDGMTDSKAAIVVEAAGNADNVIMEMQNSSAAKRMTLQYDNANINFNITDRNDAPIITFRESGNIGIGLETPASLLEIEGTTSSSSSNLLRLTRANQGSAPNKIAGFYASPGTSTSERGSITVSNFATAFNTSSDYRLKENVIPISNGIDRLMLLKPCRFNFISDDQTVDGFIAHEAQDIVPEAISGEKDQIDEDGNEVYQGIDQAKLVPLLTAALQEAIKRIEILEQKNK